MVHNLNVNVKNDLCFTLSCELVGWTTISRYQALEIVYRAHAGAVEGMVCEGKSVSLGGAQTKVDLHKCKLTKNMLLHSYLLTSLSYSLTPPFFTIRKLALRTNEIKIQRGNKQSNCIIHTFDLSQALPKYLRTFLQKNTVLMIGLTDQ